MRIGYIGLGRMGSNMAALLLEQGHEVVGFDIDPEARKGVAAEGAEAVGSIEELVGQLDAPRVVWVMVQRRVVAHVLDELVPLLAKGDAVIDGGNTLYKETLARAQDLDARGIHLIDVGVSGGTHAARHGACLMIGGPRDVYDRLEPLFADLAQPEGYGYMGSAGAGHFVKGIHNAIEYGMMAAQAEGLRAIESRREEFGTDLATVLSVYNHGSIVESALLSFLERAWEKDPGLAEIAGSVPQGDTEAEMVELAEEFGLTLTRAAIAARAGSREEPDFAGKVMAAQRQEFGGHPVTKKRT